MLFSNVFISSRVISKKKKKNNYDFKKWLTKINTFEGVGGGGGRNGVKWKIKERGGERCINNIGWTLTVWFI